MNAFWIDVEDGISIVMRDRFGKRMPQTARVVSLTERLLELLARHEVRGTFFILGQVAEVFPRLVRDIQAGGPEIGVHGYNHIVFARMSIDQARDEV